MQDGDNIAAREAPVFYAERLFKPYVVFDVARGTDAAAAAGGSRYNLAEVRLALALFEELRKLLVMRAEAARADGGVGPGECRVGVISPYRCALPRCPRHVHALSSRHRCCCLSRHCCGVISPYRCALHRCPRHVSGLCCE